MQLRLYCIWLAFVSPPGTYATRSLNAIAKELSTRAAPGILDVRTPLDPFITTDDDYHFTASNYREPYMDRQGVNKFIVDLMFPTVMATVSLASSAFCSC